jgi:uncharacterized damage-inducible protein DinB
MRAGAHALAGDLAGSEDAGMTWRAPEVKRTEPSLIASERESLQGWLDFHRATLLWKCAGLTADQLKQRAVAPSKLTLLGLVRHMTEVERWWFRMHGGDQDVAFPYSSEGDEEADFDALADADAEADLAAFQRETQEADAAVRGRHLDTVVPSRGHNPERVRDIRWIYVHMIEEYARHNGHADIIREQIDGVTGD